MKTLFDEIKIGGVRVENRFVRSATYEGMASDDGSVTERLVDMYRTLAEGGAGLIVTGGLYVSEEGKGLPRMAGIYSDMLSDGLGKIADAIHGGGAKAFAQIAYCGTQSPIGVTDETFSPSGVTEPSTGKHGKAMTAEDIRGLVSRFADAARRAKLAGFDGVELHACHGYLLSQFLSPYHNTRTDAYGGSPENRARIITEIIMQIKKEQPGLPVMIKINGCDYFDGGLVLDESTAVCRLLEKAGLDAVELSGGVVAAQEKSAIRGGIRKSEDEGYFFTDAETVAEAVSIPVISVGGYRSVEVMLRRLNESKVAGFALSRPLMAEPALIKRWENGDESRAKCVSCGRCRTPEGNRCTVFPSALAAR